MPKHKKFSFTTRYVLLIGFLLLLSNILLGLVSTSRSIKSIRQLINKNMLDVADTAAELVDGDALAAITEADVGSEAYETILAQLSVFQNNADIHYIYALRQVEPGRFVFVVDADPDDPADYGEDVVVSSGLIQAGRGTHAVDDEPLADRWGNYYSSYCPVFDSNGNVAGVIGIDFDADWYEDQVRENTVSISVTSILSVLIGGVVVFLIASRVTTKLRQVNTGLSALSANVDRLTGRMGTMYGQQNAPDAEAVLYDADDEIEALGEKIRRMQSDMVRYLDHLETQAYVDALTKVRSSSAYHETLRRVEDKIAAGTADFQVGIFDINSLKQINDGYGHETGDAIIRSAAQAISAAFGEQNTYRIGGDEFAVILEGVSAEEMDRRMDTLAAEVARVNAGGTLAGVTLAVSKGVAAFRRGEDGSYQMAFARADQRMYEDKRAYYQGTGDRRSRKA